MNPNRLNRGWQRKESMAPVQPGLFAGSAIAVEPGLYPALGRSRAGSSELMLVPLAAITRQAHSTQGAGISSFFCLWHWLKHQNHDQNNMSMST